MRHTSSTTKLSLFTSLPILSVLAAFGFAACEPSSSETSNDGGVDPSTPDASPVDDDASADAAAPTGGWTLETHSCPGPNRTDALFEDADGTLWVGCGTAATGYGLFRSSDEARTWTKAAEAAAGTLEQFRVNSIDRGPDGALYVGGVNEGDGSDNRAIRVDTSSTPFVVTPYLVSVNQVGRSFSVGTLRVLADGSAVAESLNGTDALYRAPGQTEASAASWTDVSGPLSGDTGSAEQLLDMVVHDGKLFGAGSRIAAPPYVFVTAPAAANVYSLTRVELPRAGGEWTGEMWGLAVNADRVVVVGVNQDADTGRIYVNEGDPTASADYVETNLSSIVGAETDRTWARGVCQRGQRVVVVGERQPLTASSGLVVLSEDGGKTFTNVTPQGVTASVSKCHVREDGTVVVAGAGGLVGFYR